MFLNGNFVALYPFQLRYGVKLEDGPPPVYSIETKWQVNQPVIISICCHVSSADLQRMRQR